MKRSEQIYKALWSFIAVPLLLLVMLLFFNWDRIEREVAANANELLAKQHAWARAETFNRGRDVLIIGTAPDQQAVDHASSTVLTARGVRRVDFAGTIAPAPRDAEITLEFQPESVLITGTADTEATINQLIGYAAETYAPRSIINELHVANTTASSPELMAVMTAGKTMSAGTKLVLVGSTLTVTGELPNQQSVDVLLKSLSENFSGRVVNQLSTAIAIENELCQTNIEQLLAASKINFSSGGSEIERSSYALLRNIADAMRECPDASIEVSGHTDSVGIPESNNILSRNRATSVVNALTDMGLSAERFEIAGHGSNRPIADNQTAGGRAENRRIEFKVKN